jgi:hypothetical protein
MASLEKLMTRKTGDVGVGAPIELQSLTDDDLTAISAAMVKEPFWDTIPNPYKGPEWGAHAGEPLDLEGSATYSDNPWDCIELGGHQLPGIWTVDATPAIKLDIQKPIGFDGAAVISRGYLPASLTLTGLLWTATQWSLLQDVLADIWVPAFKVAAQDVQLGKKGKVSLEWKDQGQVVGDRRSLTIVNPSLSPLRIFSVVIEQLTPLKPHSIPGVRQMTIQCLEYVPEPSRKPSAVKKIVGDQNKPRGKNAIDKKIDARATKPPSTDGKALAP